jgi:hypothetical protein
VIEVNRTVGIDVHQGARLIQVDQGEGDAELDRRQRQTLLEQAALPIESLNPGAPGAVIRGRFQLVDQPADDGLLDGHAIGRHVPAGLVEVLLAHVQGVEA